MNENSPFPADGSRGEVLLGRSDRNRCGWSSHRCLRSDSPKANAFLPLTMASVVLAILVGSMIFGIDIAFYAALIDVLIVPLTLTVVALDPDEVLDWSENQCSICRCQR
jgi:hypothetical protein